MRIFLFVKLKMKFPLGIANVDFDETMCSKETAKWFVEVADSADEFKIMCFKDADQMTDYLTSDVKVKDGKLVGPDEIFIFNPVMNTHEHNSIVNVQMLRQYLLTGITITKFYNGACWTYKPSKQLYFVNYEPDEWCVFINATEMGYHFQYDKKGKKIEANLVIYSP